MSVEQPFLFELSAEEKLTSPADPEPAQSDFELAAEQPEMVLQEGDEVVAEEPAEILAEEAEAVAVEAEVVLSPVAPAGLDSSAALADAARAFGNHMLRQGFSDNTIKAFQADLRLFGRHVGENRAVGSIGQSDLEDFMTWLRAERGVPCSPKSYARRLTTLKVFFGWLKAAEVLDKDPAAPLIHVHPTTPMPEILYDSQVNDLLRVTRDLLWAQKPDARPYVLVTLLLQTGIKKGECMEIKLEHIDLSNLQAPVLYIRYDDPRKTLKERRLALGPNFAPAFRQYLREYQPKEHIFECTARNLEYVLEEAAALAEIAGGCSFEQLRWTCAVRDYRNGMAADQLRQKLGLSMITWRETLPKIQKLARPGL
jgi:site-specific recombinase XerD